MLRQDKTGLTPMANSQAQLNSRSINIPKIQILPISHIRERGSIQISAFQPADLLALNAITAFVLAAKEKAQQDDDRGFDQVGDDHGPDAKGVGWFLRGEVEEGTDDVPGAVAEEEDGWEKVVSVSGRGVGWGWGVIPLVRTFLV